METAHTVPKGETEVAVGVGALGSSGDGQGFELEAIAPAVSARHGLTEKIDGFATLFLYGAKVGARYQVVRGAVTVAAGLEASYSSVTDDNSFLGVDDPDVHYRAAVAMVPVPVEYTLNEHLGVMAVPQAGVAYRRKEDDADGSVDKSTVPVLGLMLVVPMRFGRVTILPSMGGLLFGDSEIFSRRLAQFGLALKFGGR